MNKLFQNIPEDWQLSKIGNYSTKVEYGISKAMNSDKLGSPILRMNNLDGDGFLDLSDLKYVEIPEDIINKFKLKVNDLLFNRVNSVELVGKTSIVQENIKNIENLVFASYLIRVNVDSKRLLPEYLNYYLNSHLGAKEINRNLRRASSQANINAKELRLMKILVPPLEKQNKIISILNNNQNFIINTQKSIKILQILKKGLMQRLFTQGIGHIEFKESRLGKIPKEWKILLFNDVASDFLGGGTPSTKVAKYWGGNIPWMTSAILTKMYINEGMKFITKEGLRNSSSNLIPEKSLLISTRVGIGKVGIAGKDIAISQDLTGVIIDPNKALTEYLYWTLINSKKKLLNISQGTTIKGIERDSLKTLKLKLPPLPEQKKIVRIMNNIDKQIGNEVLFIRELTRIKTGLMQDLLSGKKRVHIQ